MSILATKAMWLVVLAVLSVGLVVGLVLGFPTRDAEAGKLKTLWAVVDENDLVRGKGATSAEFGGFDGNPHPGTHFVWFDRDVSECAYSATITGGYAGSTGVHPGDFGINPSHRVDVFTVGGSGLEDLPFHLIVQC
jgi:hypothetical protein